MDPAYLDYLYHLGEFNIKLGLETIRSMLDRLGNPHRHPRIIHIAGTNGKGSTLVALESLLLAAGYSTGSTISPHLILFNERFRINGSPIDDASLDNAFRQVCRGCGINLNSPVSEDGALRPTFFEFALAMAFVLFESAGVDFILLETGLGGRLDATNVIENPLACVITRIDRDHEEFLGDTVEQIATEKLGILKKGSPVFFAKQDEKADRFVRAYCRKRNCVTYTCPEDFYTTQDREGMVFHVRSFPSVSSVSSAFISTPVSRNGLLGTHQVDNVLTALAVYYYAMSVERRSIDSERASRVIERLHWPGRLHYLGSQREILLDGAHNESGMRALLDYLSESHSSQQILFAVGWMKKKNLIADIDVSLCGNIRFIPMAIENDRSETVENISQELSLKGFAPLPAMKCSDLMAARNDGRLPLHDLLVVAGSLYLVGEFLHGWETAE